MMRSNKSKQREDGIMPGMKNHMGYGMKNTSKVSKRGPSASMKKRMKRLKKTGAKRK